MAMDISGLDLAAKFDMPKKGLAVIMQPPCLRDRVKAMEPIAKMLGFDVVGSADIPHGYAIGGPHGQVEIFSASGAVRARNIDQLVRYSDERRNWSDTVESSDKMGRTLGKKSGAKLEEQARQLLDKAGLAAKPDQIRITLEQWARLDEAGKELESGVGRALVQYSYAVESIPLIGAGAKTNVHFDPDDKGEGGTVARFFHVNRGFEAAKELPLMGLEEALTPLLRQTWSGVESKAKRTRIKIDAATYGLLALPADVPQRYATPVLMIEGSVSGLLHRKDEDVEIRFGQYLPLVDPKMLAKIGFGSSGPILPGALVAPAKTHHKEDRSIR